MKNNFKGPMFIWGPPPPSSQHNNHCVGIRNHCVGQFSCKNYTDPLSGSIYLKKLLENSLRVPGFPSPPLAQNTITVCRQMTPLWIHGTTVWVNPTQKTTGIKQGPHLYKGGSPSRHNNPKNDCLCIRNHCVGEFSCKTKQNY